MYCSPQASSFRGIIPAWVLEWAAISSFGASSWPKDWTCTSCTGRWILHCWVPWEALCLKQQFLNGAVLPSWCIWQGLQMFSVITTRKHCWHPLLGGDQGIRSASCIAQAAPQQRLTYPAQMSVVLRLRSRGLEVLLFSLVFGCSATALQHNWIHYSSKDGPATGSERFLCHWRKGYFLLILVLKWDISLHTSSCV